MQDGIEGLQAFVDRLRPIHDGEFDEWSEVVGQYRNHCASRAAVLFWYLSSGFDTQALAFFSRKDTQEAYRTPSVDLMVYSDYSPAVFEQLMRHYEALDHGNVVVYKDDGPPPRGPSVRMAAFLEAAHQPDSERDSPGRRTHVEIRQMIPLTYFTTDERAVMNERYQANCRCGESLQLRADGVDFIFCIISFRSSYFGHQHFPVLWSSVENWVLLDALWKPLGIQFTYLCGVCDGCRKGGAYRCVNSRYRDFLEVAAPVSYWITDHNDPQGELVAELMGWGPYNGSRRVSRMLRIANPDAGSEVDGTAKGGLPCMYSTGK